MIFYTVLRIKLEYDLFKNVDFPFTSLSDITTVTHNLPDNTKKKDFLLDRENTKQRCTLSSSNGTLTR